MVDRLQLFSRKPNKMTYQQILISIWCDRLQWIFEGWDGTEHVGHISCQQLVSLSLRMLRQKICVGELWWVVMVRLPIRTWSQNKNVHTMRINTNQQSKLTNCIQTTNHVASQMSTETNERIYQKRFAHAETLTGREHVECLAYEPAFVLDTMRSVGCHFKPIAAWLQYCSSAVFWYGFILRATLFLNQMVI